MKRNRSVVGVDPGKNGAIVVVTNDDPDMSEWIVRSVNGWKLWRIRLKDVDYDLRSVKFPDHASLYIEFQHPFPRQGVSSTGKFMKHYGFLLGQATTMFNHIVEVHPSIWKRHYGILGEPKKASKAILSKYLDDRLTIDEAEAILIACYGFHRENGLEILI
ncbi:MAG: hypothetical protein QXI19_01020 [Candidatus Caldarchaeum sp.]